jgi:hypothetical protein
MMLKIDLRVIFGAKRYSRPYRFSNASAGRNFWSVHLIAEPGKADRIASVKKPSRGKAGGGVPLYQLKITLKWSEPPIWRRVVVRANMTLDHLHDVIQIVMGWDDDHPHQFIGGSGDTYEGAPNFASDLSGAETSGNTDVMVADLVSRPKQKLTYEYDFGDCWEHDIVLEKILPPDGSFKHPVCLDGANACPPEDCGGIHGYYHLLQIMADSKHPEYPEMKEWLGGKFDATKFNLARVNTALKRIKA